MDDMDVFRLNCELAQRINREALADPSSPYAGKFVAIVNGKVAFVSDNLRTAYDWLEQTEPNNRSCCLVEASREYPKVEHV